MLLEERTALVEVGHPGAVSASCQHGCGSTTAVKNDDLPFSVNIAHVGYGTSST